ncbi:aminotransferase [Bombiscardovia apis]|uniref:cysteine-S-conjugate beta-lyase n=1 Tax=Bombiscardovia apis TaxID=2932182 RepID=A0ABM8BBP1_9BIFI|nr:aminotransferase class I/II-fold pyridoxal phosphate-dependent enzyme [Bombiscardovia apis]BDR54334.1 aminotransferase [Bombiscardovia apis]
MTKYDFTSIMDRRGKDAIAIDGVGAMPGFNPDPPKEGFDIIPMWIADMNFPTVPTVPQAMIDRAKHPAYGYYAMPDSYFKAIIDWQRDRHGVEVPKEAIGYENGVIGAAVATLRSFVSPGDSVLVHSPTYLGFTNMLNDNGYNIVHSPLKKDAQGTWRMDYDDMRQKLRDNNIHVAVFCSPHNPCGRVWEREEIEEAMKVFEEAECTVISDEIWSDILLGDSEHVPTQLVSEYARNHTVATYAPSKTFNLAGLIGSYHIIYNKALRDRVTSMGHKTHYNEMNVMSMHALLAAYSPEGREWADELCQVLAGNADFAYNYIQEHFEGVEVSKPEGTYMMFLDCKGWCESHNKSLDKLIKAGWDVGVTWQDGRQFQDPWSIRLNLASPFSRIEEAFSRMDKYVFNAE